MGEREKGHLDRVALLDGLIKEKEMSNLELSRELTLEKLMTSKLEEQRGDLSKKYEEEKAIWLDTSQKIEFKLSKQQG